VILEDMKFDAELEGFFNGTGGTVNLQPQPMAFGNIEEIPLQEGASSASTAPGASSGAGAAAAAATALFGGRLGIAQAMLSGLLGAAAEKMGGAAPPALSPVKDQASSFLSKAQPWREFLWPLSVPSANQGCSRVTANLYNFQTNYAILFIVQLILSVIMQPSALMCIVITAAVWVLFLKKNEDPEWKPEVGGVVLSPMQRWISLAAVTTILLLMFVGGVIFNAALMYMLFAIVHGLIHDPTAKGIPGAQGDPVPI